MSYKYDRRTASKDAQRLWKDLDAFLYPSWNKGSTYRGDLEPGPHVFLIEDFYQKYDSREPIPDEIDPEFVAKSFARVKEETEKRWAKKRKDVIETLQEEFKGGPFTGKEYNGLRVGLASSDIPRLIEEKVLEERGYGGYVLTRRYQKNHTGKDLDGAVKIRERFMDRDHIRVARVAWEWPDCMVEVGTCEAIIYRSDKWQKDGKEIDYKHVAEGPQRLYLREDLCTSEMAGAETRMEGWPDSFAVLAKSLGLQSQLYADGGCRKLQKDYVQIEVGRVATLAAGNFRDGETFCFVYDASGVLAVVTGEKLEVLKDGIVG